MNEGRREELAGIIALGIVSSDHPRIIADAIIERLQPLDDETLRSTRHALAVVWEEGFDRATDAQVRGLTGSGLRAANPYRSLP